MSVRSGPLALPGVLLGLLVSAASAAGQDEVPSPVEASAPYLDPDLPVERRVSDLLGRMTLREKFWQLYMSPGSLDDPSHDYSAGAFGLQIAVAADGADSGVGAESGRIAGEIARSHTERINRIQRYFVEETRLGIPIVPFEEALHGLKREGATTFPQAIALAASWDTTLVGRVARAVAAETRSRGIRQVLSPVVNLATDVRWGRVEETYGEDPHLTSLMGRTFVSAFEEAGVLATPKHFVANVGRGGRDSYPVHYGERYLEEYLFPAFRTAVRDGGARSVMTAYNSVDGRPATQNPRLLNETLKREWGFAGFVISDAAATGGAVVLHHTEPSTPVAAQHAWEAGLDVVFQSRYEQHRPYLAAAEGGLVADSVIDAAVARVLGAKFELGLFEDPYVDPAEAERLAGRPEHRALAREAASSAVVLLRNEERALPLDPTRGRVAVIGTDAVEGRLGGYSGPGTGTVSILEGLRERMGSRARYAPGPGRAVREAVVVPAEHLSHGPADAAEPGLAGEYYDNIRLEGEPRIVRPEARVDFRWTLNSPGRGIPFDWYSARWTGRLSVPAGGVGRLGVEGNDGYRLWLDGELLIDNWRKRSYDTVLVDVDLEAGAQHDLRLEYFESTGGARLRLLWDGGVVDSSSVRIAEAVSLARESDVALVVAGIEEGEFRDRAFLGLPGRQEELIRAVAGTGTPTVVVLVGGSAITMSGWLDRVEAVLLAWYPGQEGGRAVADVLFGDADSGGRLPVTFPVAEGQLPLVYNHKPTGRGDDYVDLTGRPLFPFGYGLSYGEFEYSGLSIEPAAVPAGGAATVRLTVRNTGGRAAKEVVQLYLRDVLASVARPVMELKGFRPVRLAPGESREVVFRLAAEDLAMLDAEMREVVEPGRFRVMIGRSSEDIRLRSHLEVTGDPPPPPSERVGGGDER